jgi:predicted amidohydrolase
MIGQVEAGTVLVLPECAVSGYDDQLSGLDDLDPGELASARDAVSAAAVRANVHVVCGSLLFDRERWWNAAIYFSPAGQAQVYRKVNLATHERGRLAAGSALPLMRMTLAGGAMQAGVQLLPGDPFPGAVELPGTPGGRSADLSDLCGQPRRASWGVAGSPREQGGRDAAVRSRR